MFLFSFIASALTSLLLFRAVWRDRSLLVRPSIVFLIFFNVRDQWGAAFLSGEIDRSLPAPSEFFLAMYGVPFAALLLVFALPHKQQGVIYRRLVGVPDSSTYCWAAIWYLLIATGIIMTWYFVNVPFRETGMWVMLTDPLSSAQARETSFKLLPNPLLKYSYAIVMNSVAPMLGAYAGLALIHGVRGRRIPRVATSLGVIFIALLCASVSGARGPLAMVMMVIVFGWWLRKRAPLNPVYLGCALVSVLFLPILITIVREGRQVTIESASLSVKQVYSRISGDTAQVAIWYAEHAQTTGYTGIAGIKKLAPLYDLEPVDLGNLIGLTYGEGSLDTVTANTNFIIFYYTLFGLGALPPCVLLIALLDLSLSVFIRLKPAVLAGCVAASLMIITNLAEGDFTYEIASGGFGAILFLGYVLNRVGGPRKMARVASMTMQRYARQPN